MNLFLSYARQDLNIVQQMFYVLRDDQQHQVWFDLESIAPTDDWAVAIRDGLSSCDAVLLIASEHAMNSLFVTEEWQYAQSLAKPVYVWVITSCQIPVLLKDAPCFDLRADPLDIQLWLAALQSIESRLINLTCGQREWTHLLCPKYVHTYINRLIFLQMVFTGLTVVLALSNPIATNFSPFLMLIIDWWALLRVRRSLLARRMMHERLQVNFGVWLLLKILIAISLLTFRTGIEGWYFVLIGELGLIFSLRWIVGKHTFNYRNTSSTGYWRAFQRSKLRGWLLAYPARQYSPAGTVTTTNLLASASITTLPLPSVQSVLVVYARQDQHFAEYLADQLERQDTDNTLQIDLHPLTDINTPREKLQTGALITVITPYSHAYLPDLLASGLPLISVILQDTNDLPEPMRKVQWVDARIDYRAAAEDVTAILRGSPRQKSLLTLPSRAIFLSSFAPLPRGTLAFLGLALSFMLVAPVALILLVIAFGSLIVPLLPPINRYHALVHLPFATLLVSYNLFLAAQSFKLYRDRSGSPLLMAWLYTLALVLPLLGWREMLSVLGQGSLPPEMELFLFLIGLALPLALLPGFFIRLPRWLLLQLMNVFLVIQARLQIWRTKDSYTSWYGDFKTALISYDLWKPAREPELKPIIFYTLATICILLLGSGVPRLLPRDPLQRVEPPWANNIALDYAGSIEIMSFDTASGIFPGALDYELVGKSQRFHSPASPVARLMARHIPHGAIIQTHWFIDGQRLLPKYGLWSSDLKYRDGISYILSYGYTLPKGYYEIYVLIDDVYVARVTFTVE